MNSSPKSSGEPQRSPSPLKVLLIDDSEADCVTYVRYLKTDLDYSYQFLIGSTLEEGIALWNSESPTVMLVDVNLPDADGLEFLEFLQRRLIRQEFPGKVPAIVLTGQGNERVAVRAMKLGAIDYLVKDDITVTSLRKSVATAVEYAAIVQQLTRSQQQENLLSEISLRIRQSLDLSQILQSAVDGLRQLLGCDRAVIYHFQSDWSGTVTVESVCSQELSILEREILDPCLASRWHEPYLYGRSSHVDDREDKSLQPCHAELLASIQVRANLVTPIFQDESLWGLLIAHECHHPRCWDSSEIASAQQFATQVSIAIQHATAYGQLQIELRERQQAEAQLQQLNQDLEDRVAQRTTALQQSEARLQEAQHIARMGHWEMDIPSARILWSPEIFHIFGLDPTQPEPTYEENLQFFAEADRDRIQHTIQNVLKTGEPFEIDLPFTQVDGSPGYLFVRGRPVQDEHGAVVRLVGILMDISDRYQTQIRLKTLSDRLTLALESAEIGTWEWDLRHGYAWDERMYALYGQDKLSTSITYERWLSMVHPNERARVEQQMQQSLVRGKLDSEFRIVLPNRTIRYIKARGLIHHDALDRPQRMVGINYDITPQKQAEAALIRYTQDVEDLYNNAPCGYHSLDSQGCIIRVNETELNWFGYTREEMIGKPFTTFLPEEGRQMFLHYYPIFLQQGWIKDLEYDVICKDGSLLPVLLNATAVRDAQGNYLHSRGALLDIRARKQVEQQLQQTNAELRRATRLKDEFLANMSHELRTPLNAILGMSESLQDGILGPIDERQGNAIATIENSGRHLLSLINDILDLAKISSGKVELELSSTTVAMLCQSSLAFVRQLAYQKQIQMVVAIAPDLSIAMMDERRMQQVLINLLNNAVKFTPEGGKVTLEVKKQSHDPADITEIESPGAVLSQSRGPDAAPETCREWLLFSIFDTGIGIAPEDLSNLFQPFVQIDSSLNRQHPGTGLGLALVRQIMELHGGWVAAKSELGQGSCFTVALPYESPGGVAPSLLSEIKPAPLATLNQSQEAIAHRILLAEDNHANVATFYAYLTSRHYQIILAKNGREAVALAKQERPDLILMDVQMPEMDGLEAIHLIRADKQLDRIPIIALTALAMPEDQDRCLAAGANQYLSKPVKLKQLVDVIQQWL